MNDGGSPTGTGDIGEVQKVVNEIQDVQKEVGGAKAAKLGAN